MLPVSELSVPALFLAGLAASPHCSVMCGPLQIWQLRGSANRRVALGWVHAGRVLGYSLLGSVAGAIGAQGLTWLPLERYGVWIQVAAALVLVVLGLRYWRRPSPACHAGQGCTAAARAKPRPQGPRLLARGLTWALLPCAALYAVLFLAMLSASAVYGGLLLAAFGLGTVPVLAVGGVLLSRLMQPQRLRRVTAAALMALGAMSALAIPAMAGESLWCRPAFEAAQR